MRWERLFEDLAAQWEAEARRELDEEVSDRTRAERAAVGMDERLAAAVGRPVALRLVDGQSVSGEVAESGRDWILMAPAAGPATLVPFGAIASATGVPARAAGSVVARRFGLGYALRGLSRDRAVLCLNDIGGGVTTGTIDAVWSDAFDLSEHAADLPRRPDHVVASRMVPFSAIASLRPA